MIDWIVAHWEIVASVATGVGAIATFVAKVRSDRAKERDERARVEKEHLARIAELEAQKERSAQEAAQESSGKKEDLVFDSITQQALSAGQWMERALTAEANLQHLDRRCNDLERDLKTERLQSNKILEALAELERLDDRNARSEKIAATLIAAGARVWRPDMPTPMPISDAVSEAVEDREDEEGDT